VSLTDMTLRTLKPTATQVTYWDRDLKSFGIRVSPGGTMTWTLLVGQERQRIKLGTYPVIKLKDARALARTRLAEMVLGQQRKRSKTLAAAYEVFEETHLAKLRESTSYELKRLLRKHFLSKLGRRELSEIETHHITEITDRLSPSIASHAFAAIQNLLNWCVARRHVPISPLAGVPSPRKSRSRSRVLSDAELQSIWRACERRIAFDDEMCGGFQATMPDIVTMPRPFASIVQLLILTGQRRGEIAALRADYISNYVCTLPSTLTKNKREHSFPIASLSVDLLSPLLKSRSQQTDSSLSSSPQFTSQFLFPARGSNLKPFNGWSKSKAALDELSGVSDWTLHDLRRTFATRLAELGVAPHVIERLLNHVTGTVSGVAAVYNRASYMSEMRAAIELWERYLQKKVLCCLV
jgi:integrase